MKLTDLEPDFLKLNPDGSKQRIDHIFPIAAFMRHHIYEIKIINGLDNLQPLSAFENLSKNDNYDPKKFKKWLKTKNITINIKDVK